MTCFNLAKQSNLKDSSHPKMTYLFDFMYFLLQQPLFFWVLDWCRYNLCCPWFWICCCWNWYYLWSVQCPLFLDSQEMWLELHSGDWIANILKCSVLSMPLWSSENPQNYFYVNVSFTGQVISELRKNTHFIWLH